MAQYLTLFSILVLVAVFNPQPTAASPASDKKSKSKSSDDEVVLAPTVVETYDGKEHFQPDISQCDGKTMCTHIPNYPGADHIEDLVKTKFSKFELMFHADFITKGNISARSNDEGDEQFACRSRTSIIYPQAAQNKDYDWLIIINVPQYRQGVRIETCMDEGAPCAEDQGLTMPKHYVAQCKQHFIYRSLVAYDSDEIIIQDEFKIPSCCQCVIKDA